MIRNGEDSGTNQCRTKLMLKLSRKKTDLENDGIPVRSKTQWVSSVPLEDNNNSNSNHLTILSTPSLQPDNEACPIVPEVDSYAINHENENLAINNTETETDVTNPNIEILCCNDADTCIEEPESNPEADSALTANREDHDSGTSTTAAHVVVSHSESSEADDSESQFDDSDADPNCSSISSSNEDSEEEDVRNSKKRKANPTAWKKVIAKRCSNSGLEYTSTSKSKKGFKAKTLGPPCHEKCRLQCYSKFSEEERKSIFTDYWNLAELQRQRDFLLKSIETVNPKYQYTRVNSKRTSNHAFYFSIGESKYRVCKTFFKSTLAITDRPIRTVIKKQTFITKGMITSEERGKHGHHYHVDNDVKDGVRSHINAIPRIESHYCRSDSSREFIEGGKTVAQLHRDYVNICKENNKPHANYLMYNRIFNGDFNISFFIPKKDQCEDCVSFEVASAEEKENLREDYETHLREKDLSREEKQKDKENNKDNFVIAVYDLQAVLQCPRGDVSNYYYTSKLNVYNFTIYELKSKAVKCFMWDESEAKRGVCELGTCILNYLESLEDKANARETKKLDVTFYSDNCCGQQKNQFMFAMYLFAVQKYEFINSITHKFLIKRHTQNEGDSVHSVIERQVKLSLRSGPIFVPDQYMTLIRMAKKTGKPYEVHEMNHESFFDLKDLPSTVGTNFSKNTNNESVKMASFKVIKTEKEHPNKLFYKTSYDEQQFQTIQVKLARKSTTNSRNSSNSAVGLKKLYNTKVGISEKKKASILSLFGEKKSVVPQYYFNCYNNL